jgi:hypothetical protein
VEYLKIYIDKETQAKIKAAAKRAGLSESSWGRTAVMYKLGRLKSGVSRVSGNEADSGSRLRG